MGNGKRGRPLTRRADAACSPPRGEAGEEKTPSPPPKTADPLPRRGEGGEETRRASSAWHQEEKVPPPASKIRHPPRQGKRVGERVGSAAEQV